MKTMRWNGERWYADERSLWLRVRQWLVWVGGWETTKGGRHAWAPYLRLRAGGPIHSGGVVREFGPRWTRMSPYPIGLFGHRATWYGWGGDLRLGKRFLVYERRKPWIEGHRGKLFLSRNGTPDRATHWLYGWHQEDLSENPDD